MRTLISVLPEFRPVLYGEIEPDAGWCTDDILERFESVWSPSSLGFAFEGAGGTRGRMKSIAGNHIHSIVRLNAPGAGPDDERALRFLTTLADRVGADFGLIHRFDHAEAHRATGNGTMTGAMRGEPLFLVTSHTLKRGIPDIYWATLFGRRYVDMFGRERLRTAPAAMVELFPDGSALLQASLRSGDVVAPGGSFAAVRERIIEHLGREAFYDPQRPDARTVTPAFDDTIARSLWSMDPVAVELRRQAGIE